MDKKIIFGALFILILVTSCAPDPRKDAEAYATRVEADSQAATAAQAREQEADLHALEMQKKELAQEIRVATAPELKRGLKMMLTVSFYFATAAVCYSLFMTARTVNTTVQGVGRALVIRAELQANLIGLDYRTRQYPLLRQAHGTRFALSNPNDNSVTMLDVSNPADRQKIAALGAVQLAGAIAYEARKSSDPGALAMIKPTVIDAADGQIVTGAELMTNMAEAGKVLEGGFDG